MRLGELFAALLTLGLSTSCQRTLSSTNTARGLHAIALSLDSFASHECALMSDRSIRCRGPNLSGQLGIGHCSAVAPQSSVVPHIANVKRVVVNSALASTCALTELGIVYCWGAILDALPDDSGTRSAPNSRRPSHHCHANPRQMPRLHEIRDLISTSISFCALDSIGHVWCWGGLGSSPFGETPSATPTKIPDVEGIEGIWSGGQDVYLRHRSGRVLEAPRGIDLPVPGSARIPDQAAGVLCYLLPDSTARCVGRNLFGRGNVGDADRIGTPIDPGLRSVISIASNVTHTCAAQTSGIVSCWGRSSDGEVGANVSRAIDCGTDRCVRSPTIVQGMEEATMVFVGAGRSCAIRRDHSVWCWGRVESGRIARFPERVDWR